MGAVYGSWLTHASDLILSMIVTEPDFSMRTIFDSAETTSTLRDEWEIIDEGVNVEDIFDKAAFLLSEYGLIRLEGFDEFSERSMYRSYEEFIDDKTADYEIKATEMGRHFASHGHRILFRTLIE